MSHAEELDFDPHSYTVEFLHATMLIPIQDAYFQSPERGERIPICIPKTPPPIHNPIPCKKLIYMKMLQTPKGQPKKIDPIPLS